MLWVVFRQYFLELVKVKLTVVCEFKIFPKKKGFIKESGHSVDQ